MFKTLSFSPLALSPLGLFITNLWDVLIRHILQFNGSSMYGVFNTPIIVLAGEKLKINFTTARAGVSQFLINDYVQFDAANLLQLVDCTATIDGVPVASGASIAAYQDDGYYWLEITATAPLTITHVGRAAMATGYWSGKILSVGDYHLKSGSAVFELKTGTSLGAEVLPDPLLNDIANNYDYGGTGLTAGVGEFIHTTLENSGSDGWGASKERSNTLLTQGVPYLVEVEVANTVITGSPSSANIIVYLGNATNATFNVLANGDGVYQAIIICDAGSAGYGDLYANLVSSCLVGTTVSYKVVSVSVRPATDTISYKVTALTDWFKAKWNNLIKAWVAI